MKRTDLLPPITHVNPQQSQSSAWPALVDRGQSVLGPMTLDHLLQVLLRLDTDQRVFVLTLLEDQLRKTNS